MKQIIIQMIKFGVVGVICFFIDYILLFVGTEYLGIHYLVSGIFSFAVSVTVNYLLSRKFVFELKEKREKDNEFLKFVVLSTIGLIINEGVMAFLTEINDIHYLLSKIIATIIVMIYNFITRKKLMEGKGHDESGGD